MARWRCEVWQGPEKSGRGRPVRGRVASREQVLTPGALFRRTLKPSYLTSPNINTLPISAPHFLSPHLPPFAR